MSQFEKVNITVDNRKKEPIDFSHPFGSTADWSAVQPLLCQEIPLGDSTVNYSIDNTIRLSPLVAPTYGEIKFKKNHRFVPYSLIYPYYQQFLTGMPVSLRNVTYVIEKLPCMSNLTLTLLLLKHSKLKLYRSVFIEQKPAVQLSGSTLNYEQFKNLITQAFHLGGDEASAFVFSEDYFENNLITDLSDELTLELYKGFTPQSCDYVIYTAHSGGYYLCFDLDKDGKNFYKYLKTCGYKPCLSHIDDYEVCLMDLLACAKAYYDTYRVTQFDNPYESNLYKLYNHYTNVIPYYHDLQSSSLHFDELTLIDSVITECLCDSYYTEPIDFLSCLKNQDDYPSYGIAESENLKNLPIQAAYNKHTANSFFTFNTEVAQAALSFVRSGQVLNQLNDEALKKLYFILNKNEEVGFDLRNQLISRGYSEFVDNIDTFFIKDEEVQIFVEQVTSMADTSYESQGAALGEFGGKAVKNQQGDSITYTNKEGGYLVVLGVIVPSRFRVQGVKPSLLGATRYDRYNPELDGFGFQNFPKAVVGKDDQIYYTAQDFYEDSATFGYGPRMLGHKVANSVLSGDMSRHKYKDLYAPYQLDKMVTPSQVQAIRTNEERESYFMSVHGWDSRTGLTAVPKAGQIWNKQSKYNYLSNLNRIFRNWTFEDSIIMNAGDYHIAEQFDNFLIQCYISLTSYCRMLPVADTWHTIDEEKNDTNTITVNK